MKTLIVAALSTVGTLTVIALALIGIAWNLEARRDNHRRAQQNRQPDRGWVDALAEEVDAEPVRPPLPRRPTTVKPLSHSIAREWARKELTDENLAAWMEGETR